MSRDKQNFCERCLHYRACLLNSEYVPSPCSCYEDKADYRKASEVAREIFAEIEEMLKGTEAVCENKRLADIGNWIFHEYLPKKFAELKKKYTEE
jgi:hypothetical protein